MIPDAIIRVRFATPGEGGRVTPVRGPFYACPMLVADGYHDCRLMLDDAVLELGLTYEVPVKFLALDAVRSKLVVGGEVQLWEGRVVASGTIVKMLDAACEG